MTTKETPSARYRAKMLQKGYKFITICLSPLGFQRLQETEAITGKPRRQAVEDAITAQRQQLDNDER